VVVRVIVVVDEKVAGDFEIYTLRDDESGETKVVRVPVDFVNDGPEKVVMNFFKSVFPKKKEAKAKELKKSLKGKKVEREVERGAAP
jgi:hypothetical protein